MATSRSSGGSAVMSRLPRRSAPVLGSSRPATMFISVLLPQPEGPTSTRNSPSASSRSMRCSTWVAPKALETLLIDSVAMSAPLPEALNP